MQRPPKDPDKPVLPASERRSGEGAQSALERLRALEKAKAAASPGRPKRRFFG